MKLRRIAREVALVIVGSLAVLRGCNCGEEPGLSRLPPWSCEDMGRRPDEGDGGCGDGERYIKGVCAPERCDAAADDWSPDCCPGTVCIGDGFCRVRPSTLVECTDDTACATPGMRCFDRPLVSSTSKTCGFVEVADDGTCPGGGQPFNGRCVVGLPCNGGCPAGAVCNIDTNACETAPTDPPGHQSGCDQACGATQILVYSDPDSMLFAQCCAVTCECASFPDLPYGPFGRYSDIVLAGSVVLASGYDALYGDLALGHFDTGTGRLDSLEYIDGVPPTGTIVANPQGPRGGRAEPGPDVGTHTALALQNGAPRIAYYDVDTQDLKYAAYDPGTQSWNISLIDDGRDDLGANTGDVGRYTSLLIDDNGVAHVTYYAHRVETAAGLVTGARYARAKSSAPSGYGSWDRVSIEAVSACEASCASGDVCVQSSGGTPMCAPARTSCASACACDEACTDDGGGADCHVRLTERLTEPCGGSCPSGQECVLDAAGTASECRPTLETCAPCADGTVCIDDGTQAVCRTSTPYNIFEDYPRGVGLFTSLALDAGGTPLVVYYDQLRQHLRGAVANFPHDGNVTLGFSPMPLACPSGVDVGMSATLAAGPAGVAVAYQAESRTLWACEASTLPGCAQALELVDDGVREPAPGATSVNRVGAYADVALDAIGNAYLAYQDQTDNELLLAYRGSLGWKHVVVGSEGAQGSFARLLVAGDTAYVSTYVRRLNALDEDVSILTLQSTTLSTLP